MSGILTSRRAFLTVLVAAPTVLRLGLYMPVRKWIEPIPMIMISPGMSYIPPRSPYYHCFTNNTLRDIWLEPFGDDGPRNWRFV